ncbi:hypothetical protein HMPREF0658_0310 [Hoylesella marshii DSM 16973 = JCM 13450]|uniref:Uncharacterized protein n=1 Tax=Hoylesella marshii DSM 16973 = JCM 13450 TaxID=862515 RepID=E0NQ59_9BACT|nr:hypothetical protein HMPREF0658_0310 [Hoylesella marshii DSM 16973 = JCM 13450]
MSTLLGQTKINVNIHSINNKNCQPKSGCYKLVYTEFGQHQGTVWHFLKKIIHFDNYET